MPLPIPTSNRVSYGQSAVLTTASVLIIPARPGDGALSPAGEARLASVFSPEFVDTATWLPWHRGGLVVGRPPLLTGIQATLAQLTETLRTSFLGASRVSVSAYAWIRSVSVLSVSRGALKRPSPGMSAVGVVQALASSKWHSASKLFPGTSARVARRTRPSAAHRRYKWLGEHSASTQSVATGYGFAQASQRQPALVMNCNRHRLRRRRLLIEGSALGDCPGEDPKPRKLSTPTNRYFRTLPLGGDASACADSIQRPYASPLASADAPSPRPASHL